MLPSNLLRIRVSRGRIFPILAGSESELKLASRLVELYRTACEERAKKGEIAVMLQKIEEEQESSVDYRLVRGLALLLERRCAFAVKSDVDPLRARMAVFELASKRKISNQHQREEVIHEVARSMGVEASALESSMYADIDGELVLEGFSPLEPSLLLRYYNLSLIQTVLFKAMKLKFTASGNWKNIFRQIKRLGLMYTVEKIVEENGKDEYAITVDGPLSLFKMTDRYGVSLAKLLPQIVHSEEWSIQADILARNRGRVYALELHSSEVKGMVEYLPPEEFVEPSIYDSSLEEKFARSFELLNTGWKIKRESEPLVAGSNVLIPDFSFEKERVKVYLEIVGFWTEEYLRRKIEKLNSLSSDIDIIVAVDESLACSRLSRLKSKEVIYFSREVPTGVVLSHLKKREEERIEDEAKSIANEIRLTKDTVHLQEIADEYGVSLEATRRAISTKTLDGYSLFGDTLVSNRLLSELEKKLSVSDRLSHALKVLEEYSVDDPYALLEKLGYRVVWAGLDIDRSTIQKVSN
ncbi:MAG: DUF790 family protein [Conexivisphaerales archaeon]